MIAKETRYIRNGNRRLVITSGVTQDCREVSIVDICPLSSIDAKVQEGARIPQNKISYFISCERFPSSRAYSSFSFYGKLPGDETVVGRFGRHFTLREVFSEGSEIPDAQCLTVDYEDRTRKFFFSARTGRTWEVQEQKPRRGFKNVGEDYLFRIDPFGYEDNNIIDRGKNKD